MVNPICLACCNKSEQCRSSRCSGRITGKSEAILALPEKRTARRVAFSEPSRRPVEDALRSGGDKGMASAFSGKSYCVRRRSFDNATRGETASGIAQDDKAKKRI